MRCGGGSYRYKRRPAKRRLALNPSIDIMTYDETLESKEIVHPSPWISCRSFPLGVQPIEDRNVQIRSLKRLQPLVSCICPMRCLLTPLKKLSLYQKDFFDKSLEEKMKVEWRSFVGKRGIIMKGISSHLILAT